MRGNFISGKVGQDERDIEGTGRESQQRRKTPDKGPAITMGITGVLRQEIYSVKTTPKLVTPYSRLMDTVSR